MGCDRYFTAFLLKFYLSSVTVRSSNRHQTCACCRLSRLLFLDFLTLEDGTDWLSQTIGMELPLYTAYNPRRDKVSKHEQFQCIFSSGECPLVEYKCVLWHNVRKHCLQGYIHMTSQVKGLVLLSLLNISVVVSEVPSSLKTTKHETFNFWYHINKIHTQTSTSLL